MTGPTDEPRPADSVTRRDIRQTYDRIATHFARTRPAPWPEVESFLADRAGRVGLDIGVGNGRHAALLASACRSVLGLDISHAALGEAATRTAEDGFEVDLLAADAARLPVRARRVDLAVYVATLHHLPSRSLRVRSLGELARVLAPAGRALVGVWSVTHGRFDADAGFDTTIDWTLPDGTVVGRFYHIYDGDEFAADVDAAGLHREETFESAGNWYAVVRPEQ